MGAQATLKSAIPLPVLAFGLAGVAPFWMLALSARLAPAWNSLIGTVVALYAGLIVSFLGGARWGLAVTSAKPKTATVALSMAPTLGAWTVLVTAHGDLRREILGMSLALLLAWAWDVRAPDLPAWYPALRTPLTLGAVCGLLLGVIQVGA